MTTTELLIAAASSITGGGLLWALRRRIARWIARQDWEIRARRRPELAELERRVDELEKALAAAHASAAACRAHADAYRDERDNARALLEAELMRRQTKGTQ